jgi:hypothetical protein
VTTGLYQNYNLWDRLQTCVVGRSWPAEFYSWIPDKHVRNIIEQIAIETEEDYQKLVKCLNSLGVRVIRPTINSNSMQLVNNLLPKPPMCPRDNMIMLGTTLIETVSTIGVGNEPVLFQSCDYPQQHTGNSELYVDIFDHVKKQGNNVESSDKNSLCAAMIYQIENRIFFSGYPDTNYKIVKNTIGNYRPESTIFPFYLHGHIDGWFTPVGPNLIISSSDNTRPEMLNLFYQTFFPNTDIVYLKPTVESDCSFIEWQKINNGRWWIPGQENNHNLNNFVNKYFDHWLGKISETVFEVNMIIIDDKNVIVSSYNKTIFKKFQEHGITAHVCKFRHERFWDAGLSCITCELDRNN